MALWGRNAFHVQDWRVTNADQKCENSVQSRPWFWIKDMYRVGHEKQIRPQNQYDEREKTSRSATIIVFPKKPSGVAGNAKVWGTDCHHFTLVHCLSMWPWSGRALRACFLIWAKEIISGLYPHTVSAWAHCAHQKVWTDRQQSESFPPAI